MMTELQREDQIPEEPEVWFQQLYSGVWQKPESVRILEESVRRVKEKVLDGRYLTTLTKFLPTALMDNQDILRYGPDWAFEDRN